MWQLACELHNRYASGKFGPDDFIKIAIHWWMPRAYRSLAPFRGKLDRSISAPGTSKGTHAASCFITIPSLCSLFGTSSCKMYHQVGLKGSGHRPRFWRERADPVAERRCH